MITAFATRCAVAATAARTSAGMTSIVGQWPFATDSACHGFTGLMSMNASVCSSSKSL